MMIFGKMCGSKPWFTAVNLLWMFLIIHNISNVNSFLHSTSFAGQRLSGITSGQRDCNGRTFRKGCSNNHNNNRLTMGLEIKIRIVGRRKNSNDQQWLEDAYGMYDTRLRSSNIGVETFWHKSDDDLIKGVVGDSSKGHSIVLLDPTGKSCTSEKFSENMYQWLDEGGSRLSFVIGGAEGLPPELKYPSSHMEKKKIPKSLMRPKLLSLSALTFTHQFARTLLMEQIYRASEIRKGSGYHK